MRRSRTTDEVVFVTPPRKKRRSTPAPGVTVAQLKDRCRARASRSGGTKSESLRGYLILRRRTGPATAPRGT